MKSNRIALDVMGGDNAPQAILRGAIRACSGEAKESLPVERVLLVGDQERIRDGLSEAGGDPGFKIIHASQVVEMTDAPSVALRSKRDSSISVAVGCVKKEIASAVVSMGNTGALVAAATLGLGTLPGVKRPGIAVTLDLGGHPLTLLDMGANIAAKADHLVQYGLMGGVYSRECLGCDTPRVGLLNIGEESSKGTDLLKEANGLMSEAPFNFVGNVEGNAIFQHVADVVVMDGMTGNIVLKLLEGFSGFMLGLVFRELKGHGVEWGGEVLSNVKHKIDYAEYGGALLLGVNGVVVVGHGRSDDIAVSNALSLAARNLDANVNEGIIRGVAESAAKVTEGSES
ncbi:MAG: glycerol-3-phosphate acyltransferase PlsX [Planctomycetota bacterium]|jgi:glycerol-3-phosphate acyltransferase PlsX